jgi:GntR family transcriptional regulator of vanillate catabolism
MTSLDAISIRIAARSRLVDDVLHQLRELILSHKIAPGEKLVQTELAYRLGVSRTPLREAIRLLEQEGLVRIANGNRTVEVVAFTTTELIELYEIREVIDGLAASLMARRGIDAETSATMSDDLAAMRENMYPLNGEEYFKAHIAFHSTLIERCGNERLLGQIQLVRTTAASLRDEYPRRVRPTRTTTPVNAKKIAERVQLEHERIFAAVSRRDPGEAEAAARDHVRASVRLIQAPSAGEPLAE